MNIFGYALIIITILLTLIIGIKKPQMHTRVLIYDSNYVVLSDDEQVPENAEIVVTENTVIPQENRITSEKVVFETKTQPKVEQKVEKANQTVQVKPVVQTKSQKPEIKPAVEKQTTKITPKEVKTEQKTNVFPQPQTQKEQIVVQSPVVQVETPKVLTEQEELIAWNIWHSNLQNQIMKDTRMPVVPMGTVFKMTFTVDKYGKVSNVQTWSTDSKYTPYAIEFIAPVIRSYQGKSILKFPEGSQRTTATFSGNWKIAQTAKYSTPDNYNDIEKVVK